ncbi:MAG: HAD-IB family phosphatase [Bacteroidetes bacterium]|nr:HAD-IB family phosphatase [Bacteroidota bacterium]
MISIIIPAYNESSTIRQVIEFAASFINVTEVIVIDDNSQDNTFEIASLTSATVIKSKKQGKGTSMQEGLAISKNEIIIFLDADIYPYPCNTIQDLSEPIISNEFDFVKGTFNRQMGRVTELVAKPLLSLFFPELSNFKQPLSGIIAGKKSFFSQVTFEDDYGVDIGILIDLYTIKARITEIHIGDIENKMKPWNELGKMSKEVSKSIIKRAVNNKSTYFNLDEMESINIIRGQMERAIQESLLGLKKMLILDMDGTILNGRFIDTIAKKLNFYTQLINIRSINHDDLILKKSIAQLLKGLSKTQLLSVADTIPLNDDIIETINQLKKRGYIIGIISDSYDLITNFIKNKIGADFSLALELELANGLATGEIKIPSFFIKNESSKCNHNSCKSNALFHICNKYNVSISNVIAVGDGENDMCMIKFAGIGVSYCTKNELVIQNADVILKTSSFYQLLECAH